MTSHSPKPYGEHARKPKSFGFEFPVLTKESGKQRIAADSSVESPLRRVRIRLRTPPSSLPEPRKPSPIEKRPSLPTITVSRVDFWPPVSAPKNSVPGD